MRMGAPAPSNPQRTRLQAPNETGQPSRAGSDVRQANRSIPGDPVHPDLCGYRGLAPYWEGSSPAQRTRRGLGRSASLDSSEAEPATGLRHPRSASEERADSHRGASGALVSTGQYAGRHGDGSDPDTGPSREPTDPSSLQRESARVPGPRRAMQSRRCRGFPSTVRTCREQGGGWDFRRGECKAVSLRPTDGPEILHRTVPVLGVGWLPHADPGSRGDADRLGRVPDSQGANSLSHPGIRLAP